MSASAAQAEAGPRSGLPDRSERRMMKIPTLFRRHECTTLEEVNALALTDGQENKSFVISPTGELCWWSKSYAERNEPSIEGHWSYQDGYGGDSIHFPLSANETITVLAPEPEDLGAVVREAVAEVLDERERKAAEEATAREERDREVRRRLQEKYLNSTPRHASGFITPDRAS